jgi:hypothetical protein
MAGRMEALLALAFAVAVAVVACVHVELAVGGVISTPLTKVRGRAAGAHHGRASKRGRRHRARARACD